MSQQSLFPTLDQARAQGDEGQAHAALNADGNWVRAAAAMVIDWPPGTCFIAEEVVIALAEEGLTTPNAKAIGPVVMGLYRDGFIAKTGDMRPARTSHGSSKPVWVRL